MHYLSLVITRFNNSLFPTHCCSFHFMVLFPYIHKLAVLITDVTFGDLQFGFYDTILSSIAATTGLVPWFCFYFPFISGCLSALSFFFSSMKLHSYLTLPHARASLRSPVTRLLNSHLLVQNTILPRTFQVLLEVTQVQHHRVDREVAGEGEDAPFTQRLWFPRVCVVVIPSHAGPEDGSGPGELQHSCRKRYCQNGSRY